jgi:hypothetical protein
MSNAPYFGKELRGKAQYGIPEPAGSILRAVSTRAVARKMGIEVSPHHSLSQLHDKIVRVKAPPFKFPRHGGQSRDSQGRWD